MKFLHFSPTGFPIKAAMLLLLGLGTVTTVAAQSDKVTLSSNTLSLERAFQEIKTQTGLVFAVNNTALNTSRQVTVAKTSGAASDILSELLAGTGQTFELSGNYIILRPVAPQQPVQQAQQQQKAAATTSAAPRTIASPGQIQGVAIPAVTHREEVIPDPVPEPAPMGNYPSASRLTETPRFGIKTNLIGDATASVALGIEFRLAPKWTMDLAVSYNGWDFKDNRKWKHLLVQPEARYWLCESFNGHFFGLHAHWAWYNVGNLPNPPFSETMQNTRYYGYLVGGGVSYGYQWILGKRWAMEAEIGAGYAYLWYDKYQCPECGRPKGSGTKHYFGPTKASLSLIFIIK